MTETQFWLDWWIKLASALFTFAAVVVALFGPWLRHKLTPSRLRIKLASPDGHFSPAHIQVGGKTEITNSRWYHIRVENERSRWSPVTQVQVFLMRVEERNAGEDYNEVWSGEIALKWRHMPPEVGGRTVGHSIESDLISVFQIGTLMGHPVLMPHPLAKYLHRDGKCRMKLILQARGLEADSNVLAVEVAWDGAWEDGTQEMARHMVVKEV
jgi:hypothetical protein